MPTPRILALAGSLRAASHNKLLARLALEAARDGGAETTFVDLRELPLPLFDEDLERDHGLPDNARVLKDLFATHHGLIIASPEYNSSVTAVLKNTIDWVSRPGPGENAGLVSIAGKVAAILSASPGGLGGLRGLVHLRAILGNIQVLVLPDQVAISKSYEAFTADGRLKDAAQAASVDRIAKKLVDTTRKLIH